MESNKLDLVEAIVNQRAELNLKAIPTSQLLRMLRCYNNLQQPKASKGYTCLFWNWLDLHRVARVWCPLSRILFLWLLLFSFLVTPVLEHSDVQTWDLGFGFLRMFLFAVFLMFPLHFPALFAFSWAIAPRHASCPATLPRCLFLNWTTPFVYIKCIDVATLTSY